MKLLKRIIILIVIFIVISGITIYIDYSRINNNQKPVYALDNYNSTSKREVFTGLIYRVERICSNSNHEKISDSQSIKFKILGQELKLKVVLKPQENLKIKTNEKIKCTNSELVYADKDIKVYTYCLDDITINAYGKDYKIDNYLKINNYKKIIKRLRFDAISIDKSSLEYLDIDNISNNGLKVIECKTNNNNDIYIGPKNMTYQEDFCINKDDDFAFMWSVVDKHEKGFVCPENSEKEVLYEDEKNIYTFNCLMTDNIFVNTPAVRGKEEINIPIRQALDTNLITIDEAIKRGLKVNTEKKEIKTE